MELLLDFLFTKVGFESFHDGLEGVVSCLLGLLFGLFLFLHSNY